MGRIWNDHGSKRQIIIKIVLEIILLIISLSFVCLWKNFKPDLALELVQKYNILICGLIVHGINIFITLLIIVELLWLFFKFKQRGYLQKYVWLLLFTSILLFFIICYPLTLHYADANYYNNIHVRTDIINKITNDPNSLQQINTDVYKVNNQAISATKYIVTDGDLDNLCVIFYVVQSRLITRVIIYAPNVKSESEVMRLIDERFHYYAVSIKKIEENWYMARVK